jgi:hypothetical protein
MCPKIQGPIRGTGQHRRPVGPRLGMSLGCVPLERDPQAGLLLNPGHGDRRESGISSSVRCTLCVAASVEQEHN